MVDALDLPEWVQLQADDELDLVGPVAQRVLRRYGVVHPVNAHLHLPILELAGGGSLLTGAGGDQILSGQRRTGTRSPVRRARAALPSRLQTALRQRRGRAPLPWLHAAVARRMVAAQLREAAAEPRRLDRRSSWQAGRRDLRMSLSTLAAMARDNDVLILHPLADDGFVAALGRSALGKQSAMTRPELLGAIAGKAIPALAYAPRPKAKFLEVFFRSPTRELVTSWAGGGTDPALVDAAALERLWASWPPPPATAGLVQQVWLSSHLRVAPERTIGSAR